MTEVNTTTGPVEASTTPQTETPVPETTPEGNTGIKWDKVLDKAREVAQEEYTKLGEEAPEAPKQTPKPAMDTRTRTLLLAKQKQKEARAQEQKNQAEQQRLQTEWKQAQDTKAKLQQYVNNPAKLVEDGLIPAEVLVNKILKLDQKPPTPEDRVTQLEKRLEDQERQKLEQQRAHLEQQKTQTINNYLGQARDFVETNATKYPLLHRTKTTGLDTGELIATVFQKTYTATGNTITFDQAAGYLEQALTEERRYLLDQQNTEQKQEVRSVSSTKEKHTGVAAKDNKRAPITSITNKMTTSSTPNIDLNTMTDEEREKLAIERWRSFKKKPSE